MNDGYNEELKKLEKDTMERINLSNLRQTPIVLQLVDQSTYKPNCVLEYILIFKDSQEYLANFMVLQTKHNLGGYPLILGRPWMDIIDA